MTVAGWQTPNMCNCLNSPDLCYQDQFASRITHLMNPDEMFAEIEEKDLTFYEILVL